MDYLPTIIASIIATIIGGIILNAYERNREERRSKRKEAAHQDVSTAASVPNDIRNSSPTGPGSQPLTIAPRPRGSVNRGRRIRRWLLFPITCVIVISIAISMIASGVSPAVWLANVYARLAHALSMTVSYDTHVYAGQMLYGNDYIYRSNGGDNKLIMQSDGNLVLYNAGEVVWANGHNGSGGIGATYQLDIQTDGNVVEYCYNTATCNYDSGSSVWDTHTAGNSGGSLNLEANDFSVHDGGGKTIAYSCGFSTIC